MTERAVGSGAEGEPPAVVALPPTTDGLATALTMASADLPTGAGRSDPARRPYPPLFSVEPGLSATELVRGTNAQATTGDSTPPVELAVPDDLSHLLVAAPLAYYLGATVSVGADAPRLDCPTTDATERFARLPEFQHQVASLLRHVFLLDCLARDPSLDPGLVDDLWFGLPELAPAPMARRLARYLDVPRGMLRSHQPRWHLAGYFEPSYDRVPCLPHLLADLALLYEPRSEPLDDQGLLGQALDDFFRGPTDRSVAVEMVGPELHEADLHAWLAEGVAVGAYTPSETAYRNRLERTRAEGQLDVAVVLNDASMIDEHAAVERIYREAGRQVDVTVRETLGRRALAEVFEGTADFIHFIGHCDPEGLRCPDGSFDVSTLSGVPPRTFFLNACDSYDQGRALVERGAVAGGVTLRGVLNRPAVTVGTMFARLLIAGFGIDRAVSLARRQITMSTDYAVVGDGSYALVDEGAEALARVDHTSGGYRLTYEVPAARRAGGAFRDPVTGDTRLRGRPVTVMGSATEVARTLSELDCPVVFDGDLSWADAVATTLRESSA